MKQKKIKTGGEKLFGRTSFLNGKIGSNMSHIKEMKDKLFSIINSNNNPANSVEAPNNRRDNNFIEMIQELDSAKKYKNIGLVVDSPSKEI